MKGSQLVEFKDNKRVMKLGYSISAIFFSSFLACGGSQSKNTQALQGDICAANPCGDPCAANPCGDACAANPCGDPCAANPCSAGGLSSGVDWSTWSTWTKMNAAPFQSAHGKAMVDVYVKPEHVEVYKALSSPFPVGMPVAKVQYNGADQASGISKITTMVKMDAGYDSEHGDWHYGIVSADGTKTMNEGKIGSCISCHDNAEKDYLFGTK